MTADEWLDYISRTPHILTAQILADMDAQCDRLRRSTGLDDVLSERARQEAKWGEQNHDPFVYGAILGEELGEFLQAALKARFESPDAFTGIGHMQDLRKEAVQMAAVALSIVECLDRGKWTWGGHALTGEASRVEAVRAVAAAAGVDPVQAAHNAAIDCERPSCSWCRPEKGSTT
jgi:NTP pyrophosphatase (non-canonical NTP hydrolase)